MTDTAPPGMLPGITTDDQGRLTVDLSCRKCQYNLRTLPTTATCPECGEAVEATLYAMRALAGCTVWLHQLQTGTMFMFAGLVFLFVGTLIGGIVCGAVGGFLLMAVARVLLAIPGPSTVRYGWSRRWQMTVLGLMGLEVVGSGGLIVLGTGSPWWAMAGFALTLCVGMFGSLALLLIHGALLTGRLGCSYLRRASIVMAGVVTLIGLGWSGLVLGEVVAVLSGMGMSDWFVAAVMLMGLATLVGGLAGAVLLVVFAATFPSMVAATERVRLYADANAN